MNVVELSASLAMVAAKISIESGLPMADSIILATARQHDALLWTQENIFALWTACVSLPRTEQS